MKLGVLGNIELLNDLEKVDVYVNHADYKAKTGKDLASFDALKPVKNWVFKVEPQEQEDMPGAVAYKTYIDDVSKPVQRDGSGRPVYRTYFIPKDSWNKLNIPPDTGGGTESTSRKSYPVPFRALKTNEDIQPAEVTPFNLHLSLVDKTIYKSPEQLEADKKAFEETKIARELDLYNKVVEIYNTVVNK